MPLLPIVIILIVGVASQSDLELSSPAPLQLRGRPYWTSPAFRYECSHNCYKESRVDRRVDYTKSVVASDQCEISCGPNTVKRTASWTRDAYRSVFLINPKQPAASKTACMLLIVKEDLICALRSRSSARGSLSDSGNVCTRVNYRYYLDKSCDNEERSEVGEETCHQACAKGVSSKVSPLLDANRTRGVFRPCYRGRLSRGERPVEYDFCSVELQPCSKCFKWGNWTLTTPCSRTCGSPGVRLYTRSCYIMERSDILGRLPLYTSIQSHFCKAYIKGEDTKTENCGMHTVCPQWTNWGSWTLCNKSDSKVHSAKKKCKTRLRMNVTNIPKADAVITAQKIKILFKNITNVTSDSYGKSEHVAGKLDDANPHRSTRRRVCLIKKDGCPGKSLQIRLCSKQNQVNYTTDIPDINECDDEETDESTTDEISTTHQLIGVTTENSSQVLPDLDTTADTRVHQKKPKKGNNRTFTVENEGGFTSVINNYAAVLITCLLIFIVVLLFALIAICWKIMKRSRPNRYEAPPPSFSAGTLGSIPTVFGHGYPPPLGLRHGSGTFGRSEYPPNLSDAISSKGSCRSTSSNVTNKGRSRHKRPPLFTAGVVLKAGSMRQQAKFSKVSISELLKHQPPCNEPNMGSKKPSTSSLLSSASSGPCATMNISACPFQPLPPIPPDLPPGLSNNGKPFSKRNASRSSSHNPDDSSRKSAIASQSQSRAGSMSGKPIEMLHLHDERGLTPPRLTRGPFGRRLQSIEDQHTQRGRGTNEFRNTAENDEPPTENEYWSVSREEDSLPPDSPILPPLGDIKREHKPLMRVCGHREQESKKRRLRSQQSCDSAEFDSIELVDNVLYDEQKNIRDCSSNARHDGEEHSQRSSDSYGDEQVLEEPVYNSINPSASCTKGAGSDSSAENEDEYDHLYKDSSAPNSPKGPHTMRVIAPALRSSSYKCHNYEHIDIGSKSTATITQEAP